MHYAFQTPSKLHIVLDFANGGELFTHLCQREKFTENEVRIYIAEIVLSLEQLHKVNNNYCCKREIQTWPNRLASLELHVYEKHK